jgi:hypothetical protein
MSIGRDPVFFQIMQSTLNRAYPSGLPSNQVITQFAMPEDTVSVPDAIQAILVEQGYPYGWGEMVATDGAGTYSLSEPMSACWLLRLDAQIPSGSSVSLSAAIGSGQMQAIQQIDPAQTLIYADDLFQWSAAVPLGQVGMSPWNTPSGWTDSEAVWMGPVANAQSSAPIGQWLLRKWVWFSSTGLYNFAICGDGLANLYLDGTALVTGAASLNASKVSAQIGAGWHLLSISCLNTGSTLNATGVLLNITDNNGNVVENGSYHPTIGPAWQTAGYINPTWQSVNSTSDLRYAWYVIPASLITSGNVQLQVTATGSPKINGVFWYSVAPWRWDGGGQYDTTAANQTPAQMPPVQITEVVG